MMRRESTPLVRFWNEFRENRVALGALVVVVAVVGMAILAPAITPQDPYDIGKLVLGDARRPPGFMGAGGYVHWLGTDAQGRDLWSAILYGLRISVQIGVTAGVIALAIGGALGATAAFAGGRIEMLFMRLDRKSTRLNSSH